MATQANNIRGRAGRALDDIVIAELFLVQATIESASILSDGINNLREQLSKDGADKTEDFRGFLKKTGEQLVEPYSTRFKYFKEIVNDDITA